MKAAYYTDYGAARDVLKIGDSPILNPGSVRCASGFASRGSSPPIATVAVVSAIAQAIR